MKKIKILFFIEKISEKGSVGGAEKVLFNLVNHMNCEKFDITVQTLFYEDITKFLNPNITYRYCYGRYNTVTAVLSRAEAYLKVLYAFHIKDDYDMEIAFLEFGATKILSASTNKKAKKLAWVHCDFNIAVKDKAAFVRKTRGQYRKFDKIVCVSGQCKESFDTLFDHSFPSVVIHNVIDTEEIIKKSEAPLPDNIQKGRYTICSVARFSPQKNIPRLLRACRRLHAEGLDFELWLIGDGALRAEIERFIAEYGMQSYIRLCGFQPNPYPFMKAADLLVCSSDYEGFSTFMTEGVILKRPVLTTECSGMHEILDGYPIGYICENNDTAFYEALRDKIKDVSGKNINYENSIFDIKTLTKENEDFFLSLF